MATGERGQAAVGSLLWIVVMAGLLMGLARLGEQIIDDARAQTAADAAALAGAAADDTAARQTAQKNGAELISIRREGTDVQVVVRVGSATAVARARLESLRQPLQ